MKKRLLVTGGAGFIGSSITSKLLDAGFAVRVLDNLSFGKREWIDPRAEFIFGDIQDIDICRQAADGVDGVFHTAAMSRSGPSITAVEICTAQNIIGTQNMLIASRDAGVRRFIYSGSSTYYGNQKGPHREDMKQDCLNFYAFSKYAGEELCRLFNDVFPIECTVLRYFNVYGPRQPTSGPYALVLGIFLQRWRSGQTLQIHGSGNQRRDFIHVNDVAEANIAAYLSSRYGSVINIGHGTNISIKSLADLISSKQEHIAQRDGDALETLADISKARNYLNWKPTISLEVGLSELMCGSSD